MNNNKLHIVLGSSGNIGKIIIKELQNMNIPVKGISKSGRGPEGTEIIAVDAMNYDELAKALDGASVIYHCLGIPYPKWVEMHPTIMKNLIKAASLNGPETKIVYADNLYAYGKEGAMLGPLTENTPEIARDRKGKLRRELGKMLLQAHSDGILDVAIGRASDFFGPEASNSLLEEFLLPYAVKHKKSKFFADLDKKHSWIYLPDFAQALIELGLQQHAGGKVWIVPHYEAMSLKTFVTLFYSQLGITDQEVVTTRPQFFLKLAGLFSSVIKEYQQMNYQMHIDWVVDDSKFHESFKFTPTPLEEAIDKTLSSYQRQHN